MVERRLTPWGAQNDDEISWPKVSAPIETLADAAAKQRLCSKAGADTHLMGAVTSAPSATPTGAATGQGWPTADLLTIGIADRAGGDRRLSGSAALRGFTRPAGAGVSIEGTRKITPGVRLANVLIRKLEAFAPLPEDDKRLLDEVVRDVRDVGAREDLISEGDTPDSVHLIQEGFACRYKVLEDGVRQIMAYLVPGDLCDPHGFILKVMDHSIATLSRCKVVTIPRARVLEMTDRPAIARALWWASLVDESTLREWLVNNGGRSAQRRVAHLLCELLVRLQTVGLATGDRYELPITQTDLADTVGLSNVHVNRVLQSLRADRLISLQSHKLIILAPQRLRTLSGFNPTYLHLERNDTEASG